MTAQGDPAATAETFDITILFWLLLGANLSWKKGVAAQGEHIWIGGAFSSVDGNVIMTITPNSNRSSSMP